MKICHIISSFRPLIGGAERATEALCAELRKIEVDTVVITRRQSIETRAYEVIKGVPVYRLGFPSGGKWGALSFAIHCMWFILFQLRDCKIIHAQSPDTPLLVGFIAKTLLGRRLILTIHGEKRIYQMSRTFTGRLRLSAIRSSVDLHTAISPAVKDQLLMLGIPPSRIEEIPNGVDEGFFHPPTALEKSQERSHMNLSDSARVILYVGRLIDWKGVDLLLAAWAHLPDHHQHQLVILGDGPEKQNLLALSRRLNITPRFEGQTDHVISYLHAADIFVLPSGNERTASYEGLSVALIEAMFTGLAVITSDCPGNKALVEDGYNGLLFPMENWEGLQEKLSFLLNSPETCQKLGGKAYRSMTQKYSISKVAWRSKKMYELLQGSRAAPNEQEA